jgi:hypothetical protein
VLPNGAENKLILVPTANLRHMRRGASNFTSPANAAGAHRPLPSAGFFSATHPARPFEVMTPQATPLANDPHAFCDELSSPTRSELPPMNADPPGGPATKLRRTLENPIPRVKTAASNAARCHRAGHFTMTAAPVLLQADSRPAY